MRNYFNFDGIDSRDYGIFISEQETFNGAGRDIDEIQVPGRDGNLTIDNGRFNAIEHKYDAFVYRDTKTNLQDLRNALLSRRGHKILYDSLHTDEFYLAYYPDGIRAEMAPNLRSGELSLTFMRDPRRFLNSGNSAVSIASSVTEKTGSVVSFDNSTGVLQLTGAEAGISPVQTGTPSSGNPCPISGWTGLTFTRCSKNLFPSEMPDNKINAQISSGTLTSSGTYKTFAVRVKPNTDYRAAKDSTGTTWTLALANKLPALGDTVTTVTNMQNRTSYDFNTGNNTYLLMHCSTSGFSTLNGSTKHAMVREKSDPLGYVEWDGAVEDVDWSEDVGTVYGGSFDLLSGVLTVTMGNIASYAGEDINEPWLSSLDVYASGTTPTTGAQVVYTLDTPLTYQLEPFTVTLLSAINNIYDDCGDVKIKTLEPVELDNPTLFNAKPLIRVYGQGTLFIGNYSITVTGSYPFIDIDAEIGDCAYDGINANQYVTFSGDFPELPPGKSYVTYTGFSNVEITPRWWRL